MLNCSSEGQYGVAGCPRLSARDAGSTVRPRSNDQGRQSMGYTRPRAGRDGKPRYTAYYLDSRRRERSAGTFGSRRDADRAWQQAEVRAAEGRAGDPRRGRQTFRRYVEETWLPNHVIEVSTLEGYTYSLRKHILPWFG